MAEAVPYTQTPKFRAAFAWIFRPKVNRKSPDKKPRYTLLMMFPKGTDLSALKAAAQAAADKEWGANAATKVKHPKFKSPFKDQAQLVDSDGNPYAGVMDGGVAIEAWSYSAPGVAGPKIDPATGKVEVLTTDADFYSGAWARAKVRPYAWTNPEGGFGISFELGNVQKLADDDRLGGGRAAVEDDFEAVDLPDAKAATGGAGSMFD